MSISSPYVVFRAVDLGWPIPPSSPAAQAGPAAVSVRSASVEGLALTALKAGRAAEVRATQARAAKPASCHRRRSPSRATARRRQGAAPLLCWQGDLFL